MVKVKHKDKAMKAINPNMKLIAFACDPSRRAFSQLKMKDRRSQFKTEKGVDVDECKACLKGSFENVSAHFLCPFGQYNRILNTRQLNTLPEQWN